jgi:hypothetical protein
MVPILSFVTSKLLMQAMRQRFMATLTEEMAAMLQFGMSSLLWQSAGPTDEQTHGFFCFFQLYSARRFPKNFVFSILFTMLTPDIWNSFVVVDRKAQKITYRYVSGHCLLLTMRARLVTNLVDIRRVKAQTYYIASLNLHIESSAIYVQRTTSIRCIYVFELLLHYVICRWPLRGQLAFDCNDSTHFYDHFAAWLHIPTLNELKSKQWCDSPRAEPAE